MDYVRQKSNPNTSNVSTIFAWHVTEFYLLFETLGYGSSGVWRLVGYMLIMNYVLISWRHDLEQNFYKENELKTKL